MESDPLYLLTFYMNFIGMSFALWFAIYILARSRLTNITFRAVVALLAVALHYYGTFIFLINPTAKTDGVRSLAVVIALVAAHDLTYYSLSHELRHKRYWVARSILILSLLAIVLLFQAPASPECDPRLTCPSQLFSVWFLIDLFKLAVFVAVLYNLWQIKKSGGWMQNVGFYIGVLLGVSTIGYGFLGVIFNVDLPRFISSALVLAGLALLGYSVARHQALLTGRTTIADFPITLATIVIVLGIYSLIAWQVGLALEQILLLSVLVIFTHSAYDFVREILDRLLRSREQTMRRKLRSLGQDAIDQPSLQRYLRRGLAILCHNLDATSGFIAVRDPDSTADEYVFQIVASLHSLPVGASLPPKEIVIDELIQPRGYLAEAVDWLAPVFGGGEHIGLVGLGARKGQRAYSEDDLFWLEDIADDIGAMIFAHRIKQAQASLESESRVDETVISQIQRDGAEHLLSTLAYRLDRDMVKCVEEGLRDFHDYSKLGTSPLVSLFNVSGDDHIERGKLVQLKLIDILEKLRPQGKPPTEPLPREWHSYTILYGAYVDEKPAREIMGKLYISEGTYYRTRRRALRGVTRALLENSVIA